MLLSGFKKSGWLLMVGLAVGLSLMGSSQAEAQGPRGPFAQQAKQPGKGPQVGRGAKEQVPLPPGLARLSADHPGRKAYVAAKRAVTKDKKLPEGVTLPPGLAKKPADHEGRKSYIEEQKKKAEEKKEEPKKEEPKKPDESPKEKKPAEKKD